MLVYQVKGRIYRVVDLKRLAEDSGLKSEEEVKKRIEEAMKKEGVAVEQGQDGERQVLKVTGQQKDAKVKIYNKTIELVKRTNQLYTHYQ